MTPEANRSPTKGLRRPQSIGTVLTALILLAGSGLSTLFYLHNREWTETQLREVVLGDVVAIGGKVRNRISGNQLALSSLGRICSYRPEITPAEFGDLAGKWFAPSDFQPQAGRHGFRRRIAARQGIAESPDFDGIHGPVSACERVGMPGSCERPRPAGCF